MLYGMVVVVGLKMCKVISRTSDFIMAKDNLLNNFRLSRHWEVKFLHGSTFSTKQHCSHYIHIMIRICIWCLVVVLYPSECEYVGYCIAIKCWKARDKFLTVL